MSSWLVIHNVSEQSQSLNIEKFSTITITLFLGKTEESDLFFYLYRISKNHQPRQYINLPYAFYIYDLDIWKF